MTGNITIQCTKKDSFQFLFHTGEGQAILSGEPRPSKDGVLEDAAMLRRCAAEDGSYAMVRDRDGSFLFRFIGEGGRLIGTSAPFPDPDRLGRAIAALKAGVQLAEIVDLT